MPAVAAIMVNAGAMSFKAGHAGYGEDHIPSVPITQKQMENSENLYDKDVVACLTR